MLPHIPQPNDLLIGIALAICPMCVIGEIPKEVFEDILLSILIEIYEIDYTGHQFHLFHLLRGSVVEGLFTSL